MITMSELVVHRAYKMLLEPTPGQVKSMSRHAGDARWAYNWALRIMSKTDKYSYFKDSYLYNKAKSEGLALYTRRSDTSLGLTPMTKAERSLFIKKHAADAATHAKTKNAAFKARLTELLLNVLEWDAAQTNDVMRPSDKSLAKHWRRVRSQQMPWWDSEDIAVNNHAITSAFKNAVEARKRFLHDPKASGHPRFKQRGGSDSFTIFHDAKNPSIRPSARHSRRLLLPNIAPSLAVSREKKDGRLEGVRVQDGGMLRHLRSSIKRGGAIKSVTISRNADRWYASCLVEETITVPDKATPTQRRNGSVGVDLGVKVLAALSDGSVIENVRPARQSAARVKTLQRAMSTKVGAKKGEKPSKRYIKVRTKKARAEHITALRRRTATNTLSKRLVRDFSAVFIEDLNVKGMTASVKPKPDPNNPGVYLPNGKAAKSGLAKSILDVGFYEFKRQLEYKAKWHSVTPVVMIPRFAASSQTCSACQEVRTGKDRLSLSDRTFTCLSCGHAEDRDINAAKNIRDIGSALVEKI